MRARLPDKGGPPAKPYNPLEKRRLAESIVRELPGLDAHPLPPGSRFPGAGIYAIYYRGDFELYRPLSQLNAREWRQPIYVGCAIPPSLLISNFRPLWNVVVDGLGNHDPGAGRRQGTRPSWDTLHPGRAWAERLQPSALSVDEIKRRVSDHMLAPDAGSEKAEP